jgi:hypothetical protein
MSGIVPVFLRWPPISWIIKPGSDFPYGRRGTLHLADTGGVSYDVYFESTGTQVLRKHFNKAGTLVQKVVVRYI